MDLSGTYSICQLYLLVLRGNATGFCLTRLVCVRKSDKNTLLTYISTLKPETLVKKSKAQQKTAEERAAAKVARQAVCINDLSLDFVISCVS